MRRNASVRRNIARNCRNCWGLDRRCLRLLRSYKAPKPLSIPGLLTPRCRWPRLRHPCLQYPSSIMQVSTCSTLPSHPQSPTTTSTELGPLINGPNGIPSSQLFSPSGTKGGPAGLSVISTTLKTPYTHHSHVLLEFHHPYIPNRRCPPARHALRATMPQQHHLENQVSSSRRHRNFAS